MRKRLHCSSSAALLTFLAFGCSDITASSDSGSAHELAPPSFNGAGAGPPMTGSGTGMITSLVVTSERLAGRNRIQERTLTGVIFGALEGTFTEQVRGVIHGNGLVTFQATMEFTGTVAGCGSGTLTVGLSGRGQAGANPVTEASFRVIQQGQNTLKVSGTGTMHQNGPFVTYDVRYVCR